MFFEIKTESTPVEKMIASIEKVIIREGKLSSDPVIWEIHISRKVLRIDAEKIENQKVFRSQYVKAFRTPAPSMKSDIWLKIVEMMGETAEVVRAGEESERVYIANQVFEKVCELRITDDKQDAATGRGMLDYQGHFCVTSKKIEEIAQVAGYRIAFSSLSETMTELGLKKEGSENIWYGNKSIRSWWFFQSKVLDQQKGM